MNEVARAVEREFDRENRTELRDGFGFYTHGEVVKDYRTLQRLLKEAVLLLGTEGTFLTVDEWEKRRDALLAELPEGYGNE